MFTRLVLRAPPCVGYMGGMFARLCAPQAGHQGTEPERRQVTQAGFHPELWLCLNHQSFYLSIFWFETNTVFIMEKMVVFVCLGVLGDCSVEKRFALQI